MKIAEKTFPTEVITLDETSNGTQSQKLSRATRVFQQSTIGMFSSIASSRSKARRCFKILLLALCFSGFCYQCATHIRHVLDYPTTINTELRKLEEIPVPAITMCFNNSMKRSDFCDVYPHFCHKPSKELCSHFPYYCGENDTLVPYTWGLDLTESIAIGEILKSARIRKDLIHFLQSEVSEGPYLYRQGNVLYIPMICYTAHSVTHNQTIPPHVKPVKIGTHFKDSYIRIMSVIIHAPQKEMLSPYDGVYVNIHSPYELMNPAAEGIFLSPGNFYEILLTVDQEILLKEPFATKCVDYEELWAANNRTGPRSQQMCQQKCLLEMSLGCFKCVHPFIHYPNEEEPCEEINRGYDNECYEKNENILTECQEQCRRDCRILKYKIELKRSLRYTEPNNIVVELISETEDVLTLIHAPKYEYVEVFSAVGGFIGCWLGISLLDIIDLFGSVFFVRNRRKNRRTKD